MITEQQYQRLMQEYTKTGVLGTAAMKAGMHREPAAKYLLAGHGAATGEETGKATAGSLDDKLAGGSTPPSC